MQLRATRRLRLAVVLARSIERPVFAVLAPILEPDGGLRGFVGAAVESARLAEQLVRSAPTADERAYLVDSQGRTIAHPDASLVASFADLSASRPSRRSSAGPDDADSLVYLDDREEWLAGVARAPGLGWGVVVERPAARRSRAFGSGRERAFLALLAIVVGGDGDRRDRGRLADGAAGLAGGGRPPDDRRAGDHPRRDGRHHRGGRLGQRLRRDAGAAGRPHPRA